jgi:heme/copper-type cytochrome/quinol oxidase subunit 3
MSTEDFSQKSPNPVRGSDTDVFNGHTPEVKVRTKKMMMWFIIFAIVMLFSGVTSAMIVLYGKLLWVHIVPTTALWVSNALVVLSSITMVLAVKSLRAGQQQRATALTFLTLVLGIGFVFSQNAAWRKYSDEGMGYTITRNNEGLKAYHWNTVGRITCEYGKDFYIEWHNERVIKEGNEFYAISDEARQNPLTNQVMTTFNASGAMLSILIYVHIVHLFFGIIYLMVNTYRVSKKKLNADNWVSLYTGGMYWHFMGLLWLYLFAFTFYIF